ncbi:MAG: hypothetical protein SOT58_03950 [Agathobacter sp.]|nr:hypothetical protein [Agathobacter sp.]
MYLSILGLCLNMLGTFLVGFVSQGGIPKKGEPIKAPKWRFAFAGWGLVLLGFFLQLLGLIFEKV